MNETFRMKTDSSLEPLAVSGTVVYKARGWDYGLASDDSRETGRQHISVTLKEDGSTPTFTVALDDIEPISFVAPSSGRL